MHWCQIPVVSQRRNDLLEVVNNLKGSNGSEELAGCDHGRIEAEVEAILVNIFTPNEALFRSVSNTSKSHKEIGHKTWLQDVKLG